MPSRQLDVQYSPVNVLTPQGTAAATPQVTKVDIGDVDLASVELRIPPGHSGFTGVSVQVGGVSIVPWSLTPAWVIGDDDAFAFDVGMEVHTGLTVVTYNTGQFPHTHYLRFVWKAIGSDQVAAPVLSLLPLDAFNKAS